MKTPKSQSDKKDNKETTALPEQADKSVPESLLQQIGQSSPGDLKLGPDHSTAKRMRQANILQLQRLQGNQYVQRFLQRQDEDEEEAKPEFSFVSKKESYDNYDATYKVGGPVPATGTLEIEMRIEVDFRDFSPDIALEEPFKAYFKEHPLTKAQKDDFKWSEEDKKKKGEKFKTDFKSSTEKDWSGKHNLSLNDPDFSEYKAKVQLKVNLFEKGKGTDPHFVMHVQKVPEGVEARFRSFVGSEPDPDNPGDFRNSAVLDYRDPSEPEKQKILPDKIVQQIGPFAMGSATVTPELKAQIGAYNTRLADLKATITDKEKSAIAIKGRSSSPGSKSSNRKLARRRAEAVAVHVDTADIGRIAIRSFGEKNATDEEKFQRVDVAASAMNPKDVEQNVASHEMGHMLGLGDEYVEEDAEGLPKFQGDESTHSQEIRDYVKDPKVAEEMARDVEVKQSASMMSAGGEVRKGHYINFLKAIDSITGKSWSIG
jgi:outer membrane protein OmpA-like peptidoglycan-associated protein